MGTLVLERVETGPQGTFGRIAVPGLGTLFSGELPWRDNRSNVSCVPTGTYECIVTLSPRFHRGLYLLCRVRERTGVRIHPANLMGDAAAGFKCQLNGCIALGEKLGWIEKQKAVLVSAPAVRRFMAVMGDKPFMLEVRGE